MSETETTVPMDSKALFESALSDAAPAAEVQAEAAPAVEQTDQPRDEHGRFAPKVEAQPEAEAPKVEAPTPVVQAAPQPVQHEPPPGWLPAWRVREMVEAAQRKAAPPPEPVDPYVDPQKFRDQGIQEATSPLVQQLSGTREYYSRKLAIKEYGQQTVQEAFTWLQTAAANGDPKAAPILQRAMNSIDPFEEIVAGYKRDKALSTVGDDPNAWFEKELERRSTDPTFKAKLAAMQGGEQTSTQGQPQPVTNVVRLPPSLNRQPGTQSPNVVSMNDADLYRSAIS